MMTSLGTADIVSAREPIGRSSGPAAQAIRNEAKDQWLSALMRSAQTGDRVAYASLLREIAQILERVVQRRVWFLPEPDREDLVQDILLSLHAARATYDPKRPFMPWLMSIAYNRMTDNARHNSRRFSSEVLVDEIPEFIADDGAGVSSSAYGDQEALRQAVKNLPRAQRKAIELLKLRELSLKEAAATTGMSTGALKVAVHRATKTLRVSLASYR
jgi:RNA polymerase sigma factor (sigma-70 family)